MAKANGSTDNLWNHYINISKISSLFFLLISIAIFSTLVHIVHNFKMWEPVLSRK